MTQTSTILVAIADDHPMIRAGIVSLLQSGESRFRVIAEAPVGSDLLDTISRSSFQPDICLVDISMDGRAGNATVSRLKEEYPMVRSIGLSYQEHELHITRIMSAGARGYISKKTNPEELKKGIEAVHSGSIFFCDTIKTRHPELARNSVDELSRKIPSDKELHFLSLCGSPLSYKEIARVMHISARTAEHYADKLAEKLKVHTRVELALYAYRAGISQFSHS